MKEVEIYTDGFAAEIQVRADGVPYSVIAATKKISGGAPHTTNNRMELSGVIEALKSLKEPCEVVLTSDSRYVCDAVNKGWAEKWQKSGWRKADKKPALNSDLWQVLLDLLKIHRVTFRWIKGHAGFPENECCDHMAVAESQKYQK